ncbi:hypothetical protein GCM10007301_06400 [Azorhizobium oxalatiphilum]|uniref:Uncharacterized protein n=1 Tax=Azorhizobium oxalatiphilum TaxID=980631 RepID=A0A917F5X9_9HYPH|nr:hypothetical protein [Azorhizobium oxalatiphilum]GGF49853.1 hypothetical protein GCM10007301_06400 [Azorhizobium oxalatiphilum]
MTQKPPPEAPKSGAFVLGRARFEKISAVEGIRTEPATRRLLADFDRNGVGAQQRRDAITSKFTRRG